VLRRSDMPPPWQPTSVLGFGTKRPESTLTKRAPTKLSAEAEY
jgi:hypothetical protein